MYALARKTVFAVLATTLVIGTARVATAHPYPWPHYYHGPAVVINPVGVTYAGPAYYSTYAAPAYYSASPVNPAPAAEIRLINPATNQVALKYILNGGAVRLLPAGYSVAIYQESVVEFDRGGGAGWGRFGLAGGVYKFVPANGAWTLVRETAESVDGNTIATAANPVPLN
ncbi:MAG: hypothetical protein ABSG68_05015 [Thermoguttaceae bacterium]|jgi:hypothetical protein